MSQNLRTPEIAGPLGTLALSQVTPHSSTASLRAIKWHQDLERLGIVLPFALVHDFGMVLTQGPQQLVLGARCALGPHDANLAALCEQYRALLGEAHGSEAARRAPQLQMSDDLIAVVLARLLGDVARHIGRERTFDAKLPLDGSMFERLESSRLIALFGGLDRSFSKAALQRLVRSRLLVLALTDSLDLDTLRLFGMAGMAEGGALAQVELLNSLETPEANDVVNFSLELLPSVLETKARPASSTVAAFGYSGLGRRGSIDNMVLTELAWDDQELARRILDNEVLYYARERQHEDAGREHLLLIDCSASMRGERSTFARGMAMATGKKLLLEGESVVYRFFDSRLYEPHRAIGQELPTAHILSFKGERGRNPARVFSALGSLLQLTSGADVPVVHMFTHAALYIPRDTVAELRRLATLAGVFILPSGGELNLDYIDLLSAHWVVDHKVLSHGGQRAEAARKILDGVTPDIGREATDDNAGEQSSAPEVFV